MHFFWIGLLVATGPVAQPASRSVVHVDRQPVGRHVPATSTVSASLLVRDRGPASTLLTSWGGSIGALSRRSRSLSSRVTAVSAVPSRTSAQSTVTPKQTHGSLIGVISGQGLPTVLFLGPPTPNPSQGHVGFRLDLPSAARVRITVVDVMGRQAHEAEDSWPAGRHVLTWNGLNSHGAAHRTGVYFARVTVNGHPLGSRRIVFIR